jgi:phosphomannomutase
MQITKDVQQQIAYWQQANFDEETKKQIRFLQENNPQELEDAFYTRLSFGTGGLRGIMGVGPNRINKYTIQWATQGLATYVKKQFPQEKTLSVAIGYDSRHNSQVFAKIAADVLAANGIRVYLFSELRPTPLVSFACRYYSCNAAIMITASHNPPLYNGYKVYWSDGAQVLAPHDTGIMSEVNKLHSPDDVKQIAFPDSYIRVVGKEVDAAYFEAIQKLRLWPKESNQDELHILYSSLHGTGITVVPGALKSFGFTRVGFVDKQIIPDGNFPTAEKPNPEEEEALRLGIKKLMGEPFDVFFVTDPDADRIGVVVKHQNRPHILTGNQILCIAAEYVCRARKEHGALVKNAAFVKTIVTTQLFEEIVSHYQSICFDVLTGFKYIAEKIRLWDESGQYQYIFGGEESYGCLLGTCVRDKDAVLACAMMAEISLFAKKHKKTLVDLLEEIYATYGYFQEETISIDFPENKEGKEKMKQVLTSLRNAPPTAIGSIPVASFSDLLRERPPHLVSDVLIMNLNEGSQILIRPSGTEPKIKLYFKIKEPRGEELSLCKQHASQKIATILAHLKKLLFV